MLIRHITDWNVCVCACVLLKSVFASIKSRVFHFIPDNTIEMAKSKEFLGEHTFICLYLVNLSTCFLLLLLNALRKKGKTANAETAQWRFLYFILFRCMYASRNAYV